MTNIQDEEDYDMMDTIVSVDDAFKNHGNKGSTGVGCCNVIINGILVYFFYQYAYNNPDKA